jgi:hypothetical protein
MIVIPKAAKLAIAISQCPALPMVVINFHLHCLGKRRNARF